MKRDFTIYLKDILESINFIEEFINDMSFDEFKWKEMAGMRDKITNDYFGIDYNIIWKVIKNRLPDLKTKIRRVIRLKGDSLK